MSETKQRLELALRLASESSELILKYYQTQGLRIESKSDDSPVTIADRETEMLMREGILAQFPDDGVLGEEFDNIDGNSGYRWILDPIDGTKPFIHGVPLFGSLIGVEHDGRMVAGVCRFPILDEVIYAAEGTGTWWKIGDGNPVKAAVSECTAFEDARFMFTEPSSWRGCNRHDAMVRVIEATKLSRGWGDCYGHIMVATGRAEVCVDPIMSAWDIAALVPIVREAGGRFINWAGTESIDGGDGISVVPGLKDAVLATLAGC
jgi:histidinol-phosphatase